MTGRVILAQDDGGSQLAIGPVYTEASLERLRQEVSDYGWMVAAAVPHYVRGRGEGLVKEAGQ
jgi:hypothetical protein